MNHEKAAHDVDRRARLAREAEVLDRIAHPDVVELVEWDPTTGVLRTALAGRHTLATCDLTGGELAERYVTALLRSVRELHDAGWAHGRVRPEHVIVGPDGHLTLCSFGSATHHDEAHPAMLADLHDVAAIGVALLARLPVAHGRRERRHRARLGRTLDALARVTSLPMADEVVGAGRPRGMEPSAWPTLLLAALGGAAAIGLWWAGDRAAPTLGQPAVSVLRWAAVGSLGYLSLVSFLVGVATLAHATEVATSALRAAPRPLRRLLGGVVGLGVLSLAAQKPTGPPPRPTTATTLVPPATSTTATSTTTITSTTTTLPTRVDGEEATPARPTERDTPPAVATHVIAPGEHLWAVAERVVADRLGRPPTDREVGRYWRALVELNRAGLADPSDPDLVFVGQVVTLPPR